MDEKTLLANCVNLETLSEKDIEAIVNEVSGLLDSKTLDNYLINGTIDFSVLRRAIYLELYKKSIRG